MPFDKFQARREETVRRTLIVLITVPLFLVGFFTFNHLAPRLGFMERNGQLHHTISQDEEQIRRVNELCQSLPKPEKFEFISVFEKIRLKSDGLENGGFDSSTVIYRYESVRGAAEIMPTFLVWFSENGWHRIPDTSTFEKGNQKIFISVNTTRLHGFPNIYEIYCMEK